MRRFFVGALAVTTSIAFAVGAIAAPGDVDRTFGDQGVAQIDIGYFDEANDLVIQQDRKIIAVGTVSHENGGRNIFALRLQPNGALDPDFGDAGKVVPDRYHQVGPRVALQPDGKIVLATLGGNDGAVVLYRLLPDGSPDDEFGTAGVAIHLQPGGFGASNLVGVGVVADGKIVVVLWSGGPKITLARFDAQGTPDESFGTHGFRDIPGDRIPYGFALAPDGRIAVVGATFLPGRFYSDAFVGRFLENGSPDMSFDADGFAVVQQSSTGTDFRSVAFDEGGSLFVGGREFGDNPYEGGWLLAKFTSGGARDSAFGTAGIVSGEFGPGSDYILDLRLDAAGLYAAASVPNQTRGLLVPLFHEDGTLNTAYGSGGIAEDPNVISAFGTSRIALQNRGMIVAFGSIQSWVPSFNQDLYLTRYVGFDVAPGLLGPPATQGRSIRPTLTLTTPPGEASVELTLEVPTPNPGTQLRASFVLPDDTPATLVAYDVKGRVVARREIGGSGLGRHTVQLVGSGELAPGVYLVHLIWGNQRLVSRAVIVRG